MSSYIHGTAPAEQERLATMNRLINRRCMQEINFEKGDRVLDVGSGTGQFTVEIGKAVGAEGRVVGVERHAEQLNRALSVDRPESVEFRQGSAYDLPLEPDEHSSFDVVHSRFLLEHIRDPQRAVSAMVRAAKPGGRVILADDDHEILRMWPEPPGATELWSAYIRAYERSGNDPFVGRRLVALLHAANARPTRNTWIFFGACSAQPEFAAYANNLIGVLHGARDRILDLELFDESYFGQVEENLATWSRRSDAALWYGIAYAEGVRIPQ